MNEFMSALSELNLVVRAGVKNFLESSNKESNREAESPSPKLLEKDLSRGSDFDGRIGRVAVVGDRLPPLDLELSENGDGNPRLPAF